MVEKRKLKGLRSKLMLAFLLLSIVPFSTISVLFLYSYSKDLALQTTSHLVSVREIKKSQVRDYFRELEHQVSLFAQSDFAKASIGRFYGFSSAFERLGGTIEQSRLTAQSLFKPGSWDVYQDESQQVVPGAAFDASSQGDELYKRVHLKYHKEYAKLVKESDFSDIYLIDNSGNLVYSVTKQADMGTNLISGQYRTTRLASTYQKLKVQMDQSPNPSDLFQLGDFSLNPLTNKVEAYIGVPILQHSYVRGVIIFAIDNKGLNKLMSDRQGLGETGETFVIGSDNKLRSDLYGSERFKVEHSFNYADIAVNSKPVGLALQGESGAGQFSNYLHDEVLAAYTPINVFEQPWALVTEISEDEAFALTRQLEKLVASFAIFSVLLFIFFSRWLSNTITAPLLNLTWSAELVAAGDLEKPIRGVNPEGDEIGRLAHSFAHMQYSVREKLLLISEQKQELESQVALIQQQNQELQQADKLKDEFLANTSHELRTPIHGIVGMAESMIAGSAGELSDAQRQQLSLIIKSSEGLARLVNDLLDYHKMRYGQLPIKPQALDLKSVINLVFDLCKHLTGNKPVRLINQCPDNLPVVFADELRLEQVLYNLIGNAIKYTPEGKVVLTVEQQDEQLKIIIADTGIGMTQEQISHIFEPLMQVRENRNHAKSGYGLGLSVTRQLVQLMNGELGVSSKPEIGSEFVVSLPIHQDQSIEPTVVQPSSRALMLMDEADNEPEQRNNWQSVEFDISEDAYKILVVDDETINLQILQNLLGLQGYQVYCCQDGHEALAVLEVEQPDLMLVDVMMPTMTGFELCQKVRTQFDRLTLPVVFLTALNQPKDLLEGFEAGANDYLVKPFGKDELYARINAHIQAKIANQQKVENTLLKQEINQHIQVQTGLKSTQFRLLAMLEQADEVLIGVDLNDQVQFASAGAQALFGIEQEEFVHHSINDILMTPFKLQLESAPDMEGDSQEIELACRGVEGPFASKVTITPANFEEQPGWSLIFHCMPVLADHEVGHHSRAKVAALTSAITSLSKHVISTDPQLIHDLQALGPDFAELAQQLTSEPNEDPLRSQIVDTMRSALEHWQTATGEGKIELAEKSKLWRVYLDRSSLQTRTLDKYLQIDTLPKSPRWRTVLSTAEYVLEHCPQPQESHDKLQQAKLALRNQVSKSDS
ncbi:response regulator [Motilimonas pumila]|uniref:histidine kinase n=2 Tax=Motilimonas pumila TaxID=2303987 RepID=A0A418YG10_9GAMM|nr:response regulator [Motilimonas pumila]